MENTKNKLKHVNRGREDNKKTIKIKINPIHSEQKSLCKFVVFIGNIHK